MEFLKRKGLVDNQPHSLSEQRIPKRLDQAFAPSFQPQETGFAGMAAPSMLITHNQMHQGPLINVSSTRQFIDDDPTIVPDLDDPKIQAGFENLAQEQVSDKMELIEKRLQAFEGSNLYGMTDATMSGT